MGKVFPGRDGSHFGITYYDSFLVAKQDLRIQKHVNDQNVLLAFQVIAKLPTE